MMEIVYVSLKHGSDEVEFLTEDGFRAVARHGSNGYQEILKGHQFSREAKEQLEFVEGVLESELILSAELIADNERVVFCLSSGFNMTIPYNGKSYQNIVDNYWFTAEARKQLEEIEAVKEADRKNTLILGVCLTRNNKVIFYTDRGSDIITDYGSMEYHAVLNGYCYSEEAEEQLYMLIQVKESEMSCLVVGIEWAVDNEGMTFYTEDGGMITAVYGGKSYCIIRETYEFSQEAAAQLQSIIGEKSSEDFERHMGSVKDKLAIIRVEVDPETWVMTFYTDVHLEIRSVYGSKTYNKISESYRFCDEAKEQLEEVERLAAEHGICKGCM